MRTSNHNAAQGCLSENYFMQKFIERIVIIVGIHLLSKAGTYLVVIVATTYYKI